jgi:hypothetical protein
MTVAARHRQKILRKGKVNKHRLYREATMRLPLGRNFREVPVEL